MYKIIEELRADNSSNYKLEVLKKHKDNEIFKRVLLYTYDSNLNYYITKLPSYENDTVFLASLEDMFSVLDLLASGEVRGNRGIELVKTMLSNLTQPDAEVFKLILGRDLKCSINTKSINKVLDNLIPVTPYQRCSKLDEKTIERIEYPSILQKKADGLFCYVIKENGKVRFSTRNGSQFTCDKIADDLKSIPTDNIVISGELLVIDGSRELDRKTGNGLINSYIKKEDTLATLIDKKQTDKIKLELAEKLDEFNYIENNLLLEAWDIISVEDYYNKSSKLKYLDRLSTLLDIVQDLDSIMLIDTHHVNNIEEARAISQQYIDDGYEGAILKNRNALWKDGTSKDMLKIKQVIDADLLCIGVEEGSGKNEGKIGALLLESKCKKLKVKVGSGLTDKDREQDEDYFINKVIEVQYNEVIKSKSKDTYSLFLPIYVEVRNDKNDYNILEELL